MIQILVTCPKCESLISPYYDNCPVCRAEADKNAERHVYRVLPHVVCPNCSYPISDFSQSCPVCENPIDYTVKQKIDIIPVEIA